MVYTQTLNKLREHGILDYELQKDGETFEFYDADHRIEPLILSKEDILQLSEELHAIATIQMK